MSDAFAVPNLLVVHVGQDNSQERFQAVQRQCRHVFLLHQPEHKQHPVDGRFIGFAGFPSLRLENRNQAAEVRKVDKFALFRARRELQGRIHNGLRNFGAQS